MKDIHLPQHQLKTIAAVFEKILGACSAYIFGYRSKDARSTGAFPVTGTDPDNAQIFILAFSDVTNDGLAGTISDLISRQCDGLACTILLHKLSALGTESPNMRWFFDRILRRGRRLCLDRQNVPYLDFDGFTSKNQDEIRKYWHKCEAVAAFYLESASESQRVEVGLIKVSMLSIAMEFVALGLIRIFFGYSPNRYNLRFLFALCGYFSDLPDRFFASAGHPDPRFKCLFAPPTMLRHWNDLAMNEHDFEILLETCHEFLEQSAKWANIELSQPETLKPQNHEN